jgi:hypothetical protein
MHPERAFRSLEAEDWRVAFGFDAGPGQSYYKSGSTKALDGQFCLLRDHLRRM